MPTKPFIFTPPNSREPIQVIALTDDQKLNICFSPVNAQRPMSSAQKSAMDEAAKHFKSKLPTALDAFFDANSQKNIFKMARDPNNSPNIDDSMAPARVIFWLEDKDFNTNSSPNHWLNNSGLVSAVQKLVEGVAGNSVSLASQGPAAVNSGNDDDVQPDFTLDPGGLHPHTPSPKRSQNP